MATSEKSYIVGYAMAPEKVTTFIQPSFLQYAAARGINLVAVDTSKPLAEQGPFDCVVHKLYDDDWKLQLESFAARYPDSAIVDPLHAVEKLHSRVSMLLVKLLLEPHHHLRLEIPRQVVISSLEELKLSSNEVIKELGFPVIAKPLLANGTFLSHKMYQIFDKQGLDDLKDSETPLVIQEFVNHGGVIFKVYVAGGHVQCVQRKSLPDISNDKLDVLKGSIPFAQISSSSSDEKDVAFEMPPEGFMEEVARGLKEEMGINLFNFDVIRDARDENRYLVIDINYFPGYAKMPNYESMLTSFFLDLMTIKEEGEGLVKEEDDDHKNSEI
ncbi:Inositol-tetrakisphosphate 1-kinase 1 [Linum grandiflorum]